MKNLVYSLFILLMAIPVFGQDNEAMNLEIGTMAPLTEYSMPDGNNELQTLKKLKGRNGIIVIFSCNTCPFVVGSARFDGWEKDYNDLAKMATKNNLSLVLVNSNHAKRDHEDSPEEMIKHAEELGYTMPYLVDGNATMANAFGAKTTPHVFFLDASLKLVYKGSIDNSWDSKRELDVPYLEQAIKQYSLGEEISFPSTAPKGCSIKR